MQAAPLWLAYNRLLMHLQAERRDRLRKMLAQRDAEQADAPGVGQIVLQEQVAVSNELFYTEGSALLQAARREIAQFSLRRAAQRIQKAKRRREDPELSAVSNGSVCSGCWTDLPPALSWYGFEQHFCCSCICVFA